MRLITDYITPAELTGFVRADLEQFFLDEDRNFLERWFPNELIDDVNYAFSAGGDLEANIVSYRAFGAESPLGGRPGTERVTGVIPPLSEKVPLTEYENLRRRQSAEAAIRNVTLMDARRQGRGIARRLELARGEALLTGKVTIKSPTDDGQLITEIDFGRDPTHTTTAGVPWGTGATADPVNDLLAIQLKLEQKGFNVGALLLPREAVRAAVRATKVIDAAKGASVAVTQVTLADFNALLEAEGLPAVTVYNGTVAGQRTIGAKSVIALPEASPGESLVGKTLWGTTAEALEEAFELDLDNGEGPGVVSGQYKSDDPVTLWTKTAAIAVPIMAEPNSTMCMQVLE